jgi:hypothetical protein
MTSFFYQRSEVDFWSRYRTAADFARGIKQWKLGRELFEDRAFERPDEPLSLEFMQARRRWLNGIRRAVTPNFPFRLFPPCPRVFVSHKQEDGDLALKIAKAIHMSGIDVWVDIIDLPSGAPASPKTRNEALLIAGMIEMALINCTHLIAVMTEHTAPSRWVPYEYGRMKDDPPAQLTVSAWRDHSAPRDTFAEYMLLAPIFETRSELKTWTDYIKNPYHGRMCKVGTWLPSLPVDWHDLPE